MNVGSAFADDLVLFFSDNENLQDGINTLNDMHTIWRQYRQCENFFIPWCHNSIQ